MGKEKRGEKREKIMVIGYVERMEVELPGIANKNAEYPIKFKFQINNAYIYINNVYIFSIIMRLLNETHLY